MPPPEDDEEGTAVVGIDEEGEEVDASDLAGPEAVHGQQHQGNGGGAPERVAAGGH